MLRWIGALVLLLGTSRALPAQTPAAPRPKGVPAPTAIAGRPVWDTSFVRVLNAPELLAEGAAGRPQLRVRVTGVLGAWAELDCDCLLTTLYIAVSDGAEDEATLRAFRLPGLLDPKIDSLVTEADVPVLYVSYGLASQRRIARLAVSLQGVRSTGARARQ